MTSYMNAPACRMLATHCAVCARPLLDARSVELGIGPDCARRYGFNIDVSEDARAEANHLVYRIALVQDGPEVIEKCERLSVIGFHKLSNRILDRKIPIKITVSQDNRIEVKAPYSIDAVNAFRSVQGRVWDRDRKLTTFPMSSKNAVYTALQAGYSGMLAMGPKGVFKL